MVAKEINQVIQTVNGKFSPTEASDLLNELIASRINHHNIQMLSVWERNHQQDSNDSSGKIELMKKQKLEAIDLITKARKEGLKVEIIGNIEVRLSK